jgi:WD40-like Beta Propeller Repeat
MRVARVALASTVLLLAGAAAPAQAARNGRIYFSAPSRGEASGCGVASVSTKGTGYSCADVFLRDPAVAPNRKSITAVGGSDPSEIYVMRLSGKGVKRLTHTSQQSTVNFAPVFTRDSRQIMWSRFGSDNDGIFLMNADGSGQHQVLNQGQDPVFSPPGSQIAFGGTGIWVANADGSNARRIVTNRSQPFNVEVNREPSWSPDGRRIVFARETHINGNSAVDVYVMNADGSGLRQLTSNAAYEEEDPQFSPDGKSIVYYRLRHGADDTKGQIWVMRADGSGKHQVARGANPEWSTVRVGPKRPKLRIRFFKIKKHRKCLGHFDGYGVDVRTKAGRKTRFDIFLSLDGHEIDNVFSGRDLSEGVDTLRKGRHRVKVVMQDPAVHDKIVRRFSFRVC